MTIPDYQALMLPLLVLASDGKVHAIRDAREQIAANLELTNEEREELLPSGRQPVFDNRIAWAKTYLLQAGLLNAPRRAHFQITDRGRQVLAENPTGIDTKLLDRFPEFVKFRTAGKKADEDKSRVVGEDSESATPEEMLESAHQQIRSDLAADLLNRIKAAPPSFFERLVVELLVKMGYGGSRKEAGKALGRSGDEGIDGIINEDRLGLDIIYLQAKRWEGTVGRPEIQKFVGALHGKRARKGVFITTGSYSSEARDYVRNIDPKVVLIDGVELAELMIDFGLGVTTTAIYEIKRVDSDYFGDE
ncbi:restriction endonuclease [Geothermobacter hydrogeniphilus]|uniref:Restriction endonuclease n=1 Tax=Geothermobacter hydrogeniphilus TaxID=1969733 RepID=A0A1X0Y3U7_9BACT|nr:restriction endonuclease [Geothermobacter hydrogeniphilus]ORJ59860.1 restriction endonuclease [Geothermobacter hydrogeniphilus]